MRPLERGPHPKRIDSATGARVDVVFGSYEHARGHLREAVGAYCCYCEIPLISSLAVEHIISKKHTPSLIKTWTNLLLVCNNCNATKNDRVAFSVHLPDYYWPDTDRTFDIFTVVAPGRVKIRDCISGVDRDRAQATLDLCGLQKEPGRGLTGPQQNTLTDLRYRRRREVWRMAHRDRQRLREVNIPQLRETIVEKAVATGFLSIWLIAFQDDPFMVLRLLGAFRGTCQARLMPLPNPA